MELGGPGRHRYHLPVKTRETVILSTGNTHYS